MAINLINYDFSLGRKKPENIVQTQNACPFCDVSSLTNIIDREGEFIFLRNKYNVMRDSDMFVLVEADRCGVDMPDYTPEHMRALIRFGVRHWEALRDSGRYEAVIFYKNHGHLSGGTMRHAHMQIVAFHHADPSLMIDRESMEGITIAEKDGAVLSVATKPRHGYGEFNIIGKKESLDAMADYLQKTVAFIVSQFKHSGDSYNIFFYHLDDKIAIKVLPRMITSPLLIGYGIRLLPPSLDDLIERLKKTL